MKKFSELQVNDYIFECCDDFPRMTVAYRITSINKGSTQTILLMKEFGNPGGTRHLNISNNELYQCKHITSGFCNHNYWFQTEWTIPDNGVYGRYIDKTSSNIFQREYQVVQEKVFEIASYNFGQDKSLFKTEKLLIQRLPDSEYFIIGKNDLDRFFKRIY